MQPQLIVTIQPTGTRFDEPAALTLPNVDGHAPGAQVEMYSYDHDLEEFVTIGLGTVSPDGKTLTSNPGTGVIKAGWHCGSQPNGGGCADSCVCRNCGPDCTCTTINDAKKPRDYPKQDCCDGVVFPTQNLCCVLARSSPHGVYGPNKTTIAKYPMPSIIQCPNRTQVSPKIYRPSTNGCTSPFRNNPMEDSRDSDGDGVPDSAFGTGDENNPRPCDAHDLCYDQCSIDNKSHKAGCDQDIKTGLADVCLNAYSDSILLAECLNFALLTSEGGSLPIISDFFYWKAQFNACQCCQ